MAKIFVSFHHRLNQEHAKFIQEIIKNLGHHDISVNGGTKIENEDSKTDEEIRKEIRDKFLKDVDVTIVIVGSDSVNRKHIDWEIRSTIYKFENHRTGSIVVVNTLVDFQNKSWILDKDLVEKYDRGPFPAGRQWPKEKDHTSQEYLWLPERLVNSFVDNYNYEKTINEEYEHAVFPIISYSKIKEDSEILKLAINQAIKYREKNKGKWDTTTKMRRKNNESDNRKLYVQLNP